MFRHIHVLIPSFIAIAISGPAVADSSINDHLESIKTSEGADRISLIEHLKDEHIQDIDNTTKRHEFMAKTDLLLCEGYGKNQQLSKAETACSEAIRIIDQEELDLGWRPYLLRAQIRKASGRLDESEADEFRITQLFRDDPEALNGIGYEWAKRGVNLRCSVSILKDALELEDHPEKRLFYLDSLGWAYYRLGEASTASKLIDLAIQEIDRDPAGKDAALAESLLHRGDIDWHLGRKNEARSVWNEASRKLKNCNCGSEGLTQAIAQRIDNESPEIVLPVSNQSNDIQEIFGLFGTPGELKTDFDIMTGTQRARWSPPPGKYVFLENGVVHSGFHRSIDEINDDCFKKMEPKNWGEWKEENDEYFVKFGDNDYKKATIQYEQFENKNIDLDGKSYETAPSSQSAVVGLGSNPVSTAYAHHQKFLSFKDERHYSSDQISSSFFAASGVTAAGGNDDPVSGTYRINGWEIELSSPEGMTEKRLFISTSDSGEQIFFGNERYYLIE